jgi:hypothetical protein
MNATLSRSCGCSRSAQSRMATPPLLSALHGGRLRAKPFGYKLCKAMPAHSSQWQGTGWRAGI